MLFYLVKHLRPNIADRTQELLKLNDGTNPPEVCELPCVIRHVFNTKDLGLKKLKPSRDASKL